jgi:hypothetical protein
MAFNQYTAASRRDVGGTRVVAAALGVMVGISGLDHGFFEMLRGNAATGSLVVQAIGPDQRMWIHGTEEAFTLIPNFLATGILAVAVGLATIVWSIGFIDRPNGSTVFLALAALLLLVGGGIGMVVFALPGWAIARRIGRPMTWWRALPAPAVAGLARSWRWLVGAGLMLFAFALEVAIAGVVPGVDDPELALSICWLALLAVLASMVLALAGAAAADAPAGPASTRPLAAASR